MSGEFYVVVGKRTLGGWRSANSKMMKGIEILISKEMQEEGGILDPEDTAEVIASMLQEKHLDLEDALIIVWWLATTDDNWPKMMKELDEGTDFKVEITKRRGKAEAVIYRRKMGRA